MDGKIHPAHCKNGIAMIRCLNEKGEPVGYVSMRGNFWNGEGEPLRFSSFSDAERFLMANEQWHPAKIESIDPNIG